ncbi:histidine kinase [Capsulimonas corticalis]|uniref:Circadian input-output histidine kinase CikA n=1 Tax=Capsulimonas corticalis TaxID=2219043 RepID=A0A402D332_9BACT|nr:histidine kinase [Capsulimonas corticalis]
MNRFLNTPIFEDEEKSRRSKMLNMMLVSIIALLFLGTLTPLFAGGIGRRVWLDGSAISILSIILLMNRRGHLESATLIFLSLLWLWLTVGAFTGHGVHAPALAAYMLVIASAGLLSGWRFLVFFTTISILSSVILAFAEIHGRLMDTGVVHTPVTLAGSYSVIFVMMAVLMAIALRSIQEALARAHQEIEQRRASELALAQSEERYRALAQNLPNGAVMLFNADLRYTLAGGTGLSEVGLSKSGLEGKTLWEALPPDTCRLVEPMYRAALAGDSVIEEVPFADRLYSVHAAPIRDGSGQVICGMVLTQDITDRKQAENAVRDSEEKFRRIFETIEDSYMMASIGGTVISVNPALVKLLGYGSPEEIIGLNTSRDIYIDPDERSAVIALLKSAGAVNSYPLKFRRKDGVVIYADCNIHFVYDDQGQPAAVEGTFRDMTERMQSERTLQQYQEHLEDLVQQRTVELTVARNQADAANLAKSVFLANMSHELRTPLNAVLGFSYLMLTSPDLSPDQHKTLDIINRSGDHLLRLINDVLDVARIEAGREVVKPTDFDLIRTIQDVTDMMRGRAQQKRLPLIVEQSTQLPRLVRADQAKLRHILINLLGNAVKFSEYGGVTLRIESAPGESDRLDLIFEVEDTGFGISPEDQAHIFEPFFQAGVPTEQKGTGLGLTITKQFVELMGGTIRVKSVVGAGSCFRVTIPAQLGESSAVKPAEIDRGRVIGLAPGQPSYKVLIVEDQIENSTLLHLLLEGIGFQTRVVDDGAKAVEQFQSWRPDFIWMDRRMPVMDGIEATQRIRAMEGGREVRIAGLTASAFSSEQDEVLAAGMDDCIGKPFRPSEIFECMSRLLGVQYKYEEIATEPAGHGLLSVDAIAALPAELKEELKDAILALDTRQISAIIQQISERNPAVGKTLSEHAEAFAYTSMLQALQDGAEG